MFGSHVRVLGVTSSSVVASSVAYIYPLGTVTLRSNILHDMRLTSCTNTHVCFQQAYVFEYVRTCRLLKLTVYQLFSLL